MGKSHCPFWLLTFCKTVSPYTSRVEFSFTILSLSIDYSTCKHRQDRRWCFVCLYLRHQMRENKYFGWVRNASTPTRVPLLVSKLSEKPNTVLKKPGKSKSKEKVPGPVISLVWKLTFSSFRNAMLQNLVHLAFWENKFWLSFI